MQLIPVIDSKTSEDFIRINPALNQKVGNYIRPLDHEIREVFDPSKNRAFRHGECTRWILEDSEGNKIGRIAAFVNKRYKNKGDDLPIGGIGFFECIHLQEGADMLFNVAKHWLIQKGMEAMDGPINFGERDKWWGLLTEGFKEPLYGMNYNPPYYQELFENYGFKTFFNQICLGLDPTRPVSPKFVQRHAEVAKNPAFSAEYIRRNNLEKYANDFTIIYNKAYAGHGGLKEMKKEQVMILFNKMKPFMDEKIVWFAYHKQEPIAMVINIPDLNQYFKHFNGKLGLLQKLYFLWLKYRRACKKFSGLVFGIIPEFQGMGIDAFMIVESSKIIQPYGGYLDYEMQWIGDFNPKMINLVKNFGETYKSRNLITYRYLFDRTREFKRHPLVS